MDVYVMNKDFDIIGVVDGYISLIWATRYYENGDFEIYMPASEEAIELLQKDNYVVREMDMTEQGYKNVMYIDSVNIQTDVEDGDKLIITGKCLKKILSRRIIWNQTNIKGNFEKCIRKIITDNVINPQIEARKIKNFALGKEKGFTETIDMQVTGDEIDVFLKETCKGYGIGWDIILQGKTLVFELYKGENRSYSQGRNPFVVFMVENDNLISSDYRVSKTDYKNAALVAGEGEGIERKTQSVGSSSGMERYETFIDARDLSTNNGEISEVQYNAMLVERGNENLSHTRETEEFAGEVEVDANYIINVDYALGDIVEVVNNYGIGATPRIIEVIDSHEEAERKVIATFGTWEV